MGCFAANCDDNSESGHYPITVFTFSGWCWHAARRQLWLNSCDFVTASRPLCSTSHLCDNVTLDQHFVLAKLVWLIATIIPCQGLWILLVLLGRPVGTAITPSQSTSQHSTPDTTTHHNMSSNMLLLDLKNSISAN